MDFSYDHRFQIPSGRAVPLPYDEAGHCPVVTLGTHEAAASTLPDFDRSTKPKFLSQLPTSRCLGPSPTRQRVLLLLALVAATVAYAWPRTLDINRVVTVDEPVFLGMSANFYNAVAHGDFAKTAQFLYPAVPIMWTGMLGYMIEIPNYVTDHPDQIEPRLDHVLKMVHEPIRTVGGDPLAVLVAARISKIILQTGCFLVAVWFMHRLFGLAVTALATAFIAFDPFLVAHDQLLHVDGFTGVTILATMLTVAYADREPSQTRLWAFAGVMAALSWLTRLTGLVLLPIMLLVIADGAISRYRRRAQTGKAALVTAAKAAGSVVAASLATTIVVWPALWVNLSGAVQYTVGEWQHSIQTPHPWGLYFAGKTVEGDPGILFYVFVFLYKITPFTLVGLAVITVAFLFRLEAIMPGRSWRPVVILTSFVAVYSLGMASGMRKFDRYILPDFLFFDLLAAIGIIGVARLLWPRRNTLGRIATSIVVIGLVAGQVFTVLAQRPYLLDYYSPLLGGTRTAEQMVMVGWGEGLDQVANFILSQPDGETAVVRTSIHPTTLLYFLPETVTIRDLFTGADQESREAWVNTDYAVTYILQWKRSSVSRVVPYLADFAPIYTVTIDGVDFARVYDLRRIPPPPWMID
jgi:hypothetical protein